MGLNPRVTGVSGRSNRRKALLQRQGSDPTFTSDQRGDRYSLRSLQHWTDRGRVGRRVRTPYMITAIAGQRSSRTETNWRNLL